MAVLPISGAYPRNWQIVARAVKDGAGWRCDRCGHPHDPPAGRTLTVHHFDGDKANLARWNLMPLCQACHLSVQARVDPRMPIMFDPSTWAMPYVAGVYEAGLCDPPPAYDLAAWISQYLTERPLWPWWAPSITRENGATL